MSYPGFGIRPHFEGILSGITPAGAPAEFARGNDSGTTTFTGFNFGRFAARQSAFSARFSFRPDFAGIGNDADYEVWEQQGTTAELSINCNTGSAQLGSGGLYFKNESNGAEIVSVSFPNGTFTDGTVYEVEFGLKCDTATEAATLWCRINGALYTSTNGVAAGSGLTLTTGRDIKFLPNSNAHNFGAYKDWTEYAGPGVLPSGAARKTTGTTLAEINANPARTGGAAVAA